jgi:hypothetical protein
LNVGIMTRLFISVISLSADHWETILINGFATHRASNNESYTIT